MRGRWGGEGGIIAAIFANSLIQSILRCGEKVGRRLKIQVQQGRWPGEVLSISDSQSTHGGPAALNHREIYPLT